MVMAQSLFIRLRQKHPDMEIDVLAPAWSEPLLEVMPEVSQSIVMPLGHGELGLARRYRLGAALRQKSYDRAIVLPNSFKSALVPWWANIPVRTGYRGEMRYGLINDMRILDRQKLAMTVQRFVALADGCGEQSGHDYPRPGISLDESMLDEVADRFGLDRGRRLITLCPGAEYGPAKRWPERYFAEVADYSAGRGFQVVMLGSGKDREVAAGITAIMKSREPVNLAGATTLMEVTALLQLSDVAVTNDSGLMHIAASVGAGVVAIYGSSDPSFTPPLSEKSKVISLGLDCSPCFKRECPLGTLACLENISPDRVIDNINSLC
jgi:heptosyltransferase-2